MKKLIAVIFSGVLVMILFQNCAETESVKGIDGGQIFLGKINRIQSLQQGDEYQQLYVDLNTNIYTLSNEGELVNTGEVPPEIRNHIDEILVNPEICQLVPPPLVACTMQYIAPTSLGSGGDEQTVINWNQCQSHKVLCNGRTFELREALDEIANL